jgi:uncharacterized protein (DUF2252 family)
MPATASRKQKTAALEPEAVAHLSVAEREELGKKARAQTPRSSHAIFDPAGDRPDPVALLEEQSRSRVPELVPIRYGRMLVSPFTFYRGAAGVMARDLSETPVSGLGVQCCGDAHLSNFGVFASPERRMVFDINDFDETLPGPWEWDVKRLAASLMIAAQDNGFSAADADRVVLESVTEYRESMRRFAAMGNLELWYARLDVEAFMAEYGSQFKARNVARAERTLAKARTRDSVSALAKLTERVNGSIRIVDQAPLIVPLRSLLTGDEYERVAGELHELLRSYRRTLQFDRRVLLEQFEMADFARKVVGVGSVGTRAWIALMFGRDNSDPLFLQMKEAQPSVLEEFAGKSEFTNHGERVVTGQRLMQAVSDIFLGWVHVKAGMDGASRDFYGRQLRDWKGSVEVSKQKPPAMGAYGKLCGWTLARAHARSGDRVAIASYLGSGTSFDRAIVEFSKLYSAQNELDYARLAAAVQEGTIVAQQGL